MFDHAKRCLIDSDRFWRSFSTCFEHWENISSPQCNKRAPWYTLLVPSVVILDKTNLTVSHWFGRSLVSDSREADDLRKFWMPWTISTPSSCKVRLRSEGILNVQRTKHKQHIFFFSFISRLHWAVAYHCSKVLDVGSKSINKSLHNSTLVTDSASSLAANGCISSLWKVEYFL